MIEAAAISALNQAANQLYSSAKNVKVCKDQCDQLRYQCTVLLNTLHENGRRLVGTDLTDAIGETEATLEIISNRVQRWSSWSLWKSIILQSTIQQGIADMNKKLDQCTRHFSMVSQMIMIRKQEEALLVAERNHSVTQGMLNHVMDVVRGVPAIPDQPVPNIGDHMMDIQEVSPANVAGPEERHRLQQQPNTEEQPSRRQSSSISYISSPSSTSSPSSVYKTPDTSPHLFLNLGEALTETGDETKSIGLDGQNEANPVNEQPSIFRSSRMSSSPMRKPALANLITVEPRNQLNTIPSSVGVEGSLPHSSPHPELGDANIAPTSTSRNDQEIVSSLINEQPSTYGVSRMSSSELRIRYRADGVIEAATLPALFKRLFDILPLFSDVRKYDDFTETFLVSYKAFTNNEEVFNFLTERYNTASSPHQTPEQRAIERYSVLKDLISWLQGYRSYHHPQAKDIPLLKQMQAFTESIQHSSLAPAITTSAEKVRRLIEAQIHSASPVPSSLSQSPVDPSRSFDMNPKATAEALTLLEGERYSKIMPSDCVDFFVGVQENNRVSRFITENTKLSIWVRPSDCIDLLAGVEDDNGVSHFITGNAKLSFWVSASILKPDHHGKRSKIRKYFLNVAEECLKLHNYSSSSAIFKGLASPSIASLRQTAAMERSETKIYNKIDKFLSQRNKYQAYREALENSAEPCIPILHVHLDDIKDRLKDLYGPCDTIIKDDGHPDMINFRLCHDLYKQIRENIRFQPPLLTLPDRTPSQDTRIFIDHQIRSVVVNDQYLDTRAGELHRREYKEYLSYEEGTKSTGFVR